MPSRSPKKPDGKVPAQPPNEPVQEQPDKLTVNIAWDNALSQYRYRFHVPRLTRQKTLDDLTWSEIEKIGFYGKAETSFALGATKRDRMKNGMIAEYRIIGFRHDELAFGGTAPISWEMSALYPEEYALNETETNMGGWAKSQLRSVLNETFFQLLSSDLQEIIKPVIKFSGVGSHNKLALIKTVDKIWLESEAELFGRSVYGAQGEGRQYAFYNREDAPIRKFREKGDYSGYWLRSAYMASSNCFCRVSSGGSLGYTYANYPFGICVCFCC